MPLFDQQKWDAKYAAEDISREPSATELERAKSHLASNKDKRRALEDVFGAYREPVFF